uniref:Reverse transcriptase domain-containing protein n=1 Tax=Tanacetum cinerariifolium TaxID=118510 RepID=A0A6L2MZZ5_TANCI|nr:reverse transcriptase domain-containing protein [Tanacetum cinerariifolium]
MYLESREVQRSMNKLRNRAFPESLLESARWVWDTSTWGCQGEGYGTVSVGEVHEHSIFGKKSCPPLEDPERTIRRRNRGDPALLVNFEEINMVNNNQNNHDQPPPEGPNVAAPDLRTIEELCQPTLNGRGGPIAPVSIQANDFGLKHHSIQQVYNSFQFHGLPGDDANKHLDKFLHITQSMKQNEVTDDALRLYLFPYSLTHHATTWRPEECYDLIENITGHHNDWDTTVQMGESCSSLTSSNAEIAALKNEIKLHFDLSFANALLHMPKFATMFKSLLNNKEKLFDLATTPVNEICSVVIIKKLPEKLRDPDKFFIPYDFPELVECLALADLGASISLMPLSIWEKLSLPELTPTQMILELANRSTTRPASIAEDLFVKVGKFHFPTDFVVVNYAVDPRDSDFLLEEANAFFAIKDDLISPKIDDSYYDSEGDIRLLEKFLNDDPSSPLPPKELKFIKPKTEKSSIDKPPELELKDLHSHLEYAFLEGADRLPVIIANNIKDDEMARLLKVLKSHKHAIAWKLSDIKGIDP